MNKLYLVGGDKLKKYSIADFLWKTIRQNSKISFEFSMVELPTEKAFDEFWGLFQKDRSSIGFNVALPWKEYVVRKVDVIEVPINISQIANTIYKLDGILYADNTDVIGISKGLEHCNIKIPKLSSILVLGMGGAGKATAEYLSLGIKNVYGYDVESFNINKDSKIKKLLSLNQLQEYKYDLIINATPLGKYYFDRVINGFSSPLSLKILENISKPNTILQEMNYFPIETSFLEMGRYMGFKTISGVLMLVFQAIESYKRYFGEELTESTINIIIEKMIDYVKIKENYVYNLIV